MPRTLVMSVRYALRISVDDATEETPSAAYRSGSPEAVESGAAGIVAEAVLDERSRQKAHAGCADEGRADAAAEGGSVAERFGRKVESRAWSRSCEMRGVACVACVEVIRRDATRRDDGKTPPRKTQGRKIGGEPAKRLDRERPDRADRKGTDAFHRLFGSTGCRYEIPFLFRVPAWRHEKRRRKTQSCCASARHFAETSARARF